MSMHARIKGSIEALSQMHPHEPEDNHVLIDAVQLLKDIETMAKARVQDCLHGQSSEAERFVYELSGE